MQGLNESIEMKRDSQIHKQHRVMRRHMIKLDVIKNMAHTKVIGRCKLYDAIDAVPLFLHIYSICLLM